MQFNYRIISNFRGDLFFAKKIDPLKVAKIIKRAKTVYLIKHLLEQEFTHENKKVNKKYHFRKFCSTWKMTEIDRWRHLHIDTLRYCIENKTGTHCIQYTSIHKD